jgi:hypothetical protein
MMARVTVTAVVLGAYSSRKYGARPSYYLDRAELDASQSRTFTGKVDEAEDRAAVFLQAAEGVGGELTEKNRRWADDELLRGSLLKRAARSSARLEQSFRRAAERPWDGPPPDPADPALYGLEGETRQW